MKKRALSFFLAFILVFTLLIPVSSADVVTNVKVESVQGYVSQFVDVKVSMATDMDVSLGKLTVKYDPRLELVSFANGTVFENTYSAITGEENGTFTYVGDFALSAEKTVVSAKNSDVIFTLKFRIPATATASDSFSVSVLDAQSSFSTSVDDNGVQVVDTAVLSMAGEIGVLTPADCSAHSFGADTVVRATSYLQGGYSYKTCSSCGYVDATSTSPTATNVFTLIGTAIRYAGNPSGIGAHFKVNTESLKAIEALGYSVELGITLEYGDKTVTQIFYGNNTPEVNKANYEDGVISACIEKIKTQQKGNIYAYVMIIDESGAGRIEKTYATLGSNRDISIADVVNKLNFNKYSQASKDYLNAVANGFEADE